MEPITHVLKERFLLGLAPRSSVVVNAEGMEDVEQGGDEGEELEGDRTDAASVKPQRSCPHPLGAFCPCSLGDTPSAPTTPSL